MSDKIQAVVALFELEYNRSVPFFFEDGGRPFSETSINFYQTALCHIPEDIIFYSYPL
jgi:hypothetical protein